MKNDVEFDESVIEMLRKKLEERLGMELEDFNQYQIIELWVNKSCR